MKTPILNTSELADLEFQELSGNELDNGDYYRSWALYKGECELHLTYNYKKNGDFQNGYFELNGEMLKGRQLTKKDIELLTEIM